MLCCLMVYFFEEFQLDTEKCELFSMGKPVPVEPQVLALLRLLIENRERLVGKDEIVERIWNGRAVSDAAIASRLKSARQAIGDNGRAQRLIRTVHKLGFRFVAAARTEARAAATVLQPDAAGREQTAAPGNREAARPSIAVLPFVFAGDGGRCAGLAEALPHDLIVELSRLRWLFVIARGSSFRFRGGRAEAGRVKAALNVRYCLAGAVETAAGEMTVTVELCDAGENVVIWSEQFRGAVDSVHDVRRKIVHAVVNALELQIPLCEARRAESKSPENLDAWSAYHLGLHHMYRFSQDGNARAAAYFEQAAAKEPGFARAYAGLSFTHFEDAFLNFADDVAGAARLARRFAEKGLEHDPLDPFCNLVMGRVFWLDGNLEACLPWLDRAIELNPNYAQGRYSRAWTEVMLCQSAEGRSDADMARALSPLDPLLYGMLGVRAFTHILLDEPSQAAHWADLAARAPRAHALIEMIAAVAHSLDGKDERARFWARSAVSRQPGLGEAEFLRAFPFRDSEVRARIAGAFQRLDL